MHCRQDERMTEKGLSLSHRICLYTSHTSYHIIAMTFSHHDTDLRDIIKLLSPFFTTVLINRERGHHFLDTDLRKTQSIFHNALFNSGWSWICYFRVIGPK